MQFLCKPTFILSLALSLSGCFGPKKYEPTTNMNSSEGMTPHKDDANIRIKLAPNWTAAGAPDRSSPFPMTMFTKDGVGAMSIICYSGKQGIFISKPALRKLLRDALHEQLEVTGEGFGKKKEQKKHQI